jgi:hypothetical protein
LVRRVQTVDRALDLVLSGHHGEELAAEGDPQVVHRHDVAWIGDRDHRCPQATPHRNGPVTAGEVLRQDRLCARGKRRVGEVDEAKLVLVG